MPKDDVSISRRAHTNHEPIVLWYWHYFIKFSFHQTHWKLTNIRFSGLIASSACVYKILLYSWRFSRYSAPIHWLVHGHMTSNIETVSRQMPWAGNIAKTMTLNGKQFTVAREMFTATARDQSVHVIRACSWRWPDVVGGISPRFSKFAFVLFCYITHLMTDPLGNSEFFSFESRWETSFRETLRF